MTDEKSIKTLRYQRGYLKGLLTRFETFLSSTEETVTYFQEVRNRYQRCEPLLKEFESITIQINTHPAAEAADLEEEIIFEEKYFYVTSLATTYLSTHDNSIRDSTQTDRENSSIASSQTIPLPTVNLPTFSGRYEDWIEFSETFKSVIHENKTLSNIQKFTYLKSSLNGEAAQCIIAIKLSENNYDTAWQTLCERFENKRMIVRNHIKALCDLPQIFKDSRKSVRYMLDTILQHTRSLENLQIPVQHWDDILIYILSNKLDNATYNSWNDYVPGMDLPTMEQFKKFLTRRCQFLETNPSKPIVEKDDKRFTKKTFIVSSKSTNIICSWCNKGHFINQCEEFIKLTISERITQAKSKQLCLNCLRKNHKTNECKSSSCRKCNMKHNTLLHLNNQEPKNISEKSVDKSEDKRTALHCRTSTQVLLSTAIVNIEDIWGNFHPARILLDNGSQVNFITKNLVEELYLEKTIVNSPVTGISGNPMKMRQEVTATFNSRTTAYRTSLNFLVIDKITDKIPLNAIHITTTGIKIPGNIQLADPEFNKSKEIDVLIGAEIFYSLLSIGQIKLCDGKIILQKTCLGWLVTGKVATSSDARETSLCNLTINSIDNTMKKFWQLENFESSKQLYTKEEQACEDIFVETVKRTTEGRFIVNLPLKLDSDYLGNSREIAEKRFLALERKLNYKPELKQQYSDFIHEYINLGHMHKTEENDGYFLPHHGVVKESSLTTKLRVVFDASCKTTSGYSLNDILMVGPKLQEDLFSILCRFRTHQFVLSADITKMYRQIRINNEQTKLQRILWRDSPEEPLQTYELDTVTYGTASASFLAVRSMQHLAHEEAQNFPIGSRIVLQDFYMDDLLTGAKTFHEAKHLRNEVTTLLQLGGFELRKWTSNLRELVEDIPGSDENFQVLTWDKSSTIKTLGLQWNPAQDFIEYSAPTTWRDGRVTKRSILSYIAQIFDPLGLMGPIIITAKIIIQRLWLLKLGWDESVPVDIHTNWTEFRKQLNEINLLKIPRKVIYTADSIIEFHGFCDSSEKAYGACIYITSRTNTGETTSRLLCAKSRVAPLKKQSLPRLELCGATLLAELMDSLLKTICLTPAKISYYTDSTIVLAWIQSEENKWKTFVANRVSEIQNLTNPNQWYHVKSNENPADVISRGISPSELKTSNLWWHGPNWIVDGLSPKNTPVISLEELPEIKSQYIVNTVTVKTNNFGEDNTIFLKYSSFNKLIAITALCLRFIRNCKVKKLDRTTGLIDINELNSAKERLVLKIQSEYFYEEIERLKKGSDLRKDSRLRFLYPFLDKSDILRVGGRLNNSNLTYDRKHPIILPPNNQFTNLIIECEHKRLLHAGNQSTLAALRQNYWIISGKGAVKRVLRQCITCFKANPKTIQPLMGDLPASRTLPARPFQRCGVDYCGPFMIKEGQRKNCKITKTYAAIFVCFATKATHIELVRDLTTEAFLNTLRRFISRRGKPSDIYSDNATNFIGANTELKELHRQLTAQISDETILKTLSSDNIQWHYIPARSPHFGGLWEAAVKSVKYHLRRIMGNIPLTYEETYSLLVQIEAILNSRPLTPLSDDPNDLSFLSPAHFLIGDSLMAIAEPNLCDLKVNHLSRWQHLQQMRQHFWNRWSKEYLSQLQTRAKWTKRATTTLEPGQLVLLKDDNLPPLQWKTGRIVEVHPGQDDIVRAATVQTTTGRSKRATNRLCVFPLEAQSTN